MLPGDEKNRRTVTPHCAPSPTNEWWVIQWIMDGGEQQSWDTILWKFRFHFMANVGFLLPISLLHLFILLMALFITNLPRLFPLRKPRLQKNQQYTPHPQWKAKGINGTKSEIRVGLSFICIGKEYKSQARRPNDHSTRKIRLRKRNRDFIIFIQPSDDVW